MKRIVIFLSLAACGVDLEVPAPDASVADAGEFFHGPLIRPTDVCSCQDRGATTYTSEGVLVVCTRPSIPEIPVCLSCCHWIDADAGSP